MPINSLPTPPTRSDPVNFNSRADAFLAALPAFAAEANVLQSDVNAKQIAAATSATNALASENAAAANSSATIWVSDTTYDIGNVRFSPTTYLSYRRKTAGDGTTDPSADNTNWQLINGTGNVDLNSTQTLTNKAISTGSTVNGIPIANLVNTTADQNIGGFKTFSGLVEFLSETEATVRALKSGGGGSMAYLFNNANSFGIYDSIYGALIAKDKATGVVSIAGNTTDTINSGIAGSSVGGVGTYAFLNPGVGGTYEPGSTSAGSNLRYAGINSGADLVGGTAAGTWRCMGRSTAAYASLWLRIS